MCFSTQKVYYCCLRGNNEHNNLKNHGHFASLKPRLVFSEAFSEAGLAPFQSQVSIRFQYTIEKYKFTWDLKLNPLKALSVVAYFTKSHASFSKTLRPRCAMSAQHLDPSTVDFITKWQYIFPCIFLHNEITVRKFSPILIRNVRSGFLPFWIKLNTTGWQGFWQAKSVYVRIAVVRGSIQK